MFDFFKVNKQAASYTIFSVLLPVLLGSILASKYNGMQFGKMVLLATFYIISEVGTRAFETYQENKDNDSLRNQKNNGLLLKLFGILYVLAGLLAFLIGSMTHMLITFLLIIYLVVNWLLNSESIPLKQTFYFELLTIIFSGIFPTLIAFYIQIQFISSSVVQLAVFPALFIFLFTLLKNRFNVNGKFKVTYLLFFSPYLYQIILIGQGILSVWSLLTSIGLLYTLRCISFLTYKQDVQTATLSLYIAYFIFIVFLILPVSIN